MFHLLSDLFERLLKRFLSRYKRTRSSYRKIQITLRPSIRRKHSTEEKLFWNEIYRSLRTFSHDWPTIAGFAQFMQGAMRAFSAAPQAMMHQFEGVTGAEKRAAGQPAAGQPAAQAN